MRQQWLSRRALAAHVGLAVVASLCLVAGLWQLDRARSGNSLSWAYAVQWPLFAAVAIVMWWQLIHHDRETAGADSGDTAPDTPSPKAGPVRRREDEDRALRAYNDELELLATVGRRKTWRNPKGAP